MLASTSNCGLARAMKRVAFALLVVATMPPMTLAQGPSMAETKRWLERDAPSLMRMTARSEGPVVTQTIKQQVTKVGIDTCVMRWDRVDTVVTAGRMDASVHHYRMALRNIDVGSLLVQETARWGEPVAYVRLRPRVGVEGGRARPEEDVPLYVSSKADGERVAAAVKQAALLCGAPKSPF